ncbi:BhlA/UviB family holin-like peptide [Paenibacillus wulumuqiensis]|uniref:BhlA/UviB family holin-like peptide n=1 Tax=Paenibacillus wulumuqiensis TaxID=1567107 RepID=UPI0006194915|nr:BhlA/UviB family holin-like peptide [Paenibacillus wulumuqiensis]
MDPAIMQSVLTQGPFAALFVWLLFRVMKQNAEREAYLQSLLDKFSEKYDLIIERLDGINVKITDKTEEDK